MQFSEKVDSRSMDEQLIIKFWWRSRSPSAWVYWDCFPNSIPFRDRGLRCNYNVITSLALGGGMHCLSAPSWFIVLLLCAPERRMGDRAIAND